MPYCALSVKGAQCQAYSCEPSVRGAGCPAQPGISSLVLRGRRPGLTSLYLMSCICDPPCGRAILAAAGKSAPAQRVPYPVRPAGQSAAKTRIIRPLALLEPLVPQRHITESRLESFRTAHWGAVRAPQSRLQRALKPCPGFRRYPVPFCLALTRSSACSIASARRRRVILLTTSNVLRETGTARNAYALR